MRHGRLSAATIISRHPQQPNPTTITSSPSTPNRSPKIMNNPDTPPKPADAEQPRGKGLDETTCSGFVVSDANLEGVVGSCKTCGQRVASYLCNASVIDKRPEAGKWDYWMACTNPQCGNHYGEGYLWDHPSWFLPNN